MTTTPTTLLQSGKFVVFSGSERLDLGPKRPSVICESEAQALHMITLWPGTGYYEPIVSDPPSNAPPQRLTAHYNLLTEAEHERLSVLAEECSEVIQAACKILRHGYESNNNGQLPQTNRQELEGEIGHVHHAIQRMIRAHDVKPNNIESASNIKALYITPYLHHQKPLATER